MTPLVWLGAAAAAAAAAYWFASRALRADRSRRQHDENEERYRAWRGRAAPRRASPPRSSGSGQRRELAAALALAGVALGSLIAFFLTSG